MLRKTPKYERIAFVASPAPEAAQARSRAGSSRSCASRATPASAAARSTADFIVSRANGRRNETSRSLKTMGRAPATRVTA